MDLSDLRQAAIGQLKQNAVSLPELRRQSAEELNQELQVHQIELEMQNDELRRAQMELEESRAKYASLFDFAPVGYVTLDADSRIVEANLTIAKLLGLNRGILLGQTFSKYAAPEDATLLHRHLRETNSTDAATSCEMTLIHADGSLVRVRCDSICSGDGKCSITIADMSQNAELIRAKLDGDARLRVMCHALPIPVAYLDHAATYVFNNAAHESWFKISRESITGRNVQDVLGDEIHQAVRPSIERALGGQACSFQFELSNGESGSRFVEVHYAPHHMGDEGGGVGLFELMFDVSANRHVEEAAAKRDELERQLEVLTPRQRSVLKLLLAGMANKVIAMELDLGRRTVERDRHEILKLLGVDSINELLVRFAGLAASNDTEGDSK